MVATEVTNASPDLSAVGMKFIMRWVSFVCLLASNCFLRIAFVRFGESLMHTFMVVAEAIVASLDLSKFGIKKLP